MCLYANKENPLKGKVKIVFDEKGYTTCWKVYQRIDSGLHPPFKQHLFVENGHIKSNRMVQKAGYDGCDDKGINYYPPVIHHLNNFFTINRGIHVYLSERRAKESAGEFWGDYDSSISYIVVPVRCHKSQLVAISRTSSEAVFMKVFLKKSDYDKAVKG